jgi:myosin heavy subunit
MLDNKKDMKRHSVGGYTLENDSPDARAATKIQAEIRGYLARKHVQALKEKNAEAATKIQAHIRGFLTRKNLNKDSPSRSSHHSHEDELVH